MIIFVFILIGLSAFLSGFIFGLDLKPINKAQPKTKTELKSKILTKEYENFLNYDGSEQL